MPLDAEPPNNRSVQRDENLDVVRTSRDQESLEPKGPAGESAPDPLLSVVCPFPAQPLGSESIVGAIDPWQQIHFGPSSDQPHRGGQICKINRPSLGCPPHNSLVGHRCLG